MENLVDKASNNIAQKCDSHELCSDNNLEFQVNNESETGIKDATNSNSGEVLNVDGELAIPFNSFEPISCSSKTNSGTESKLESHESKKVVDKVHLSANSSSKNQNESLTITITSNQQNAINENVNNSLYSAKNSQSTNTEQVDISLVNVSNNKQESVSQSLISMSASLLNLSGYKSDSEETDVETPNSETGGESQNEISNTIERISASENIVINKEASGSLCNYIIFSESSSEDSSSDSESLNKQECGKTDVISNSACYRKTKESSSDSETSSSEDSDNEEEDDTVNATNTNTVKKKVEISRVKGELSLEDLPPVPDLSLLKIDVKEEDCIQMGIIASIVDKLVMVQSLPNTPAYDVDTLLFLEKGKRPLGHIYDVIGPVSSPMYAVRFNSRQEIDEKGIAKELAVYSAPKTEHTQYVFLKELLRIKGSDASWQGDNEVPPEFVDFSDDDEELSATNCTNDEFESYRNKRKRNSLERHQIFEMEMNQRNKLDSAYHRLKDSCEPKFKKNTNSNAHANRTYNPFAGNNAMAPPAFTSQQQQQPNTNFLRPNNPPAFGLLPQPQWSFVPTMPPPPPPAPGFGMQPIFQNHFCQPFPPFPNQVLAFPPLNVPPPCTVPPMNIPPPLPPTGNMQPPPPPYPLPHQKLNVDRTTSNRRHGKPSPSSSSSSHHHHQTNIPLVKTQNYPHPLPKAPPPITQHHPMAAALGPHALPTVTNYAIQQPMYRPFTNCAPLPPGTNNTNSAAGFRPNGNALLTIPKGQGTGGGQVCPMPYPPCLGLPKFTTPSPNVVNSNGNHHHHHHHLHRPPPPNNGPHFSGLGGSGVPPNFGPVPPTPCTQNNGRARYGGGGGGGFGSQNGCGFYRKQF